MVKKWLFKVFARKALVSITKAAVSYLTAGVVSNYLVQYGVQIDPNRLQEGLTVAALAFLKLIEDKYELAQQNKAEVQGTAKS